MTYKEFADEMVAKYGFVNWQCEEAWKAGHAAALASVATTKAAQPVTEDDITAAREFLKDVSNGQEMRSALCQLRKEVIIELVNRDILGKSYLTYVDQCRKGE